MATETNLGKVHVFPSKSSYETNKANIGENDLSLVPIEISDGLLPVGTVIAMAANSAPDGFILCNGAAVSRSTYAALYAKIGTTYGTGDGSTTFNLPNLTDKFIQGSGTAGTVKSASATVPDHIHAMGNHNDYNGGTWICSDSRLTSSSVKTSSSTTHYVWWNGSGTGDARTEISDNTFSANLFTSLPTNKSTSTVQPPAVTMRMYIKY